MGWGGRAGADLTGHMLARVEELSLGVRSYKAHYDLVLKVSDTELIMKGILLYKWPGWLRNEMTVDFSPSLSQVLYWKDGILWQYLPSSKVVFRQEEGRLRERYPEIFASQDLLSLRSPFDLVETGSIRFLEEEKGEGARTHYLFEGIPKKAIQAQGALSPKLCRFRVSTADGLLRDFIMYDASGQEIYKQRFWDIQVNLELLDEEFEFELPNDVEIVEVTKETDRRLDRLAKGASP